MRNYEFRALRTEILQWQTRRITVLTATVGISIAILGWIITNPQNWYWEVAASILLIFLALGCYMIWIFGRFVSKIGTYIQVFYDDPPEGTGWESRLKRFSELYVEKYNFNKGIASIYLILGVVSILVPYMLCGRSPYSEMLLPFFFSLGIFIIKLKKLAYNSYPRGDYVKVWEQIKREEINKPKPNKLIFN